MKAIYRVTLEVTPPAIFREDAYKLVYEVEAWDKDDAENRAFVHAVRSRGVWREWAEVKVEKLQAVRA
jgi:hypothetical protein